MKPQSFQTQGNPALLRLPFHKIQVFNPVMIPSVSSPAAWPQYKTFAFSSCWWISLSQTKGKEIPVSFPASLVTVDATRGFLPWGMTRAFFPFFAMEILIFPQDGMALTAAAPGHVKGVLVAESYNDCTVQSCPGCWIQALLRKGCSSILLRRVWIKPFLLDCEISRVNFRNAL